MPDVPMNDDSAQDLLVRDADAWAGRPAAAERGTSSHVPMRWVLDLALGGLDRQIVESAYGHHVRECAACARGLAAAENERPRDFLNLHQLPEFSGCERREEPYPLEVTAKERLCAFIRDCTGELVIVAGEANPAVYGSEVAGCLRERAVAAMQRGRPRPQIVCGPAMGLGGDIRSASDAILPQLAEEGLVDLFAAKHRMGIHFRANLDRASVFTEAYHGAGDPGRRLGVWYRGDGVARLFARRFRAIVASGLARPAARDGFEYLPMGEIGEIARRVGNDRFDAADRDELRRLRTAAS